MAEEKKKPEFKASMGSVSLAVWKSDNGKSVSLQKSYKNKSGEWENQSVTLFPQEFATLTSLLIHYRLKVLDKLSYVDD